MMDSGDEAEKIRRDDDNWNDAESRRNEQGDGGAPATVVQTYSEKTYPTTATNYFAVKRAAVLGTETEGRAGTITVVGAGFYAFNLGKATPPVGTNLIATFIEQRWVFRYDG